MYRNPYHGYSSDEYGGYGQGETYRGDQTAYQGQEHTQVGSNVWRTDSQHTSTYRVQQNPSPPDGSQHTLLKPERRPEVWPGSTDPLAASWAFTLSLHSLWSLPITVLQQGGLAFLLAYILTLAILGAPLLLTEMFLGQYSALAPARLYRHLAPVLSGLGIALVLLSAVRAVTELGVLMWLGQAVFKLFYNQDIDTEFLAKDVLNRDDSSLGALGGLSSHLLLVLGIAALSIFVLVVAGSRALGRVSLGLVPLVYTLLVTLTIRALLAPGAPQAAVALLAPDWTRLTQPQLWLTAAAEVVFSLQLGLGAVTAFSGYSKFRHNLVRDCGAILGGHLLWLLLGLALTLCLLGAAQDSLVVSPGSPVLAHLTGRGLWLAGVTLLERSLASLSHGWLWAGLYFILLCLVGASSLFGYLEVISSSFASISPGLRRLKPLISFTVLALIFLVCILLATQGGIHVYHLLESYPARWPSLLTSLLTVASLALCHGLHCMIRDLADMSKMTLPHWLAAHLSVLLSSVCPALLTAAAVHSLYQLYLHQREEVSQFGRPLPGEGWQLLLGWGLLALPALPVLLGALLRLAWLPRGQDCLSHLRQCVKPTDEWYRHEHAHLSTSTRTAQSSA